MAWKVSDYATAGRGFKSRRPDQINQRLRSKALSQKAALESSWKARKLEK
jgi:hypothetical protein